MIKNFVLVVLTLYLNVIYLYGEDFILEEGVAAKEEAVNYYNEGVIAQKENDLEKALTAYKKAFLMSMQYAKYIINNEGVMYAQKGDLNRAEFLFKEALRIDPDYLTAQLNLGLIYEKKGDKLKALEHWYKIFKIEEKKPKNFILEDQKIKENK